MNNQYKNALLDLMQDCYKLGQSDYHDKDMIMLDWIDEFIEQYHDENPYQTRQHYSSLTTTLSKILTEASR